jgi:hypothetical protein
MSTSTPNHQAEILARTIRSDDGSFPEEAARCLLEMQITDADRLELAAKARKGELTELERSELEDYERVASLLELLQSKASLSLKRSIEVSWEKSL